MISHKYYVVTLLPTGTILPRVIIASSVLTRSHNSCSKFVRSSGCHSLVFCWQIMMIDDDDDDDGRIYFETARTRNSKWSDDEVRMSCKTEQKARSSVYCGKLAVMAMPVLTPADCSKQMQQPPGRHIGLTYKCRHRCTDIQLGVRKICKIPALSVPESLPVSDVRENPA